MRASRRRFGLLFACAMLLAETALTGAARAQLQELNELFNEFANVQGRVQRLYDAGRYPDALLAAKRYVALARNQKGEGDREFATAISWEAAVLQAQGRFGEAEPLYRQALAIYERTLGPNDAQVAITLNSVAEVYRAEGRQAEAEPLLKRAIAVTKAALGADHADVGKRLSSLAGVYKDQQRYGEAESLYKRALAIEEKALGPEHLTVAGTLNNLSGVYWDQDRFAEAEAALKRALAIYEKVLPPGHPSIGMAQTSLGMVYSIEGRYAEAEPLLQRALRGQEKALGADHPVVGVTLGSLAVLSALRGDDQTALAYQRRGTAIRRKRGEVGGKGGKRELSQAVVVDGFRFHVLAADRVGSDRSALLPETFEVAQWALQTEAADALAQMSARFAAGAGDLAATAREQQDLMRELELAESRLSAAAGRANAGAAAQARADIASLEARIAAHDRRLAKDFPEYAEFVRPKALDIGEAQALLSADEALVLFLEARKTSGNRGFAHGKLPEETFAWVLTTTTARWLKLATAPSAIAAEVAALRCGLDSALWRDPAAWPSATKEQREEKEAQSARRRRCLALVKTAPRIEFVEEGPVAVLPFDAARAYRLYLALFSQAEDLISGKHLLIVPSGALTSLPLSVLVTAPPEAPIPATLAEYRRLAWLGTRQPISVLPSVASLKALRRFAKSSRASKPYLGIGNPLLTGDPEDAEDAERAKLAAHRQSCSDTGTLPTTLAAARSAPLIARAFAGGQADIDKLREWPPLPETANELCEVARRLGVAGSEVLLGDRATEAAVKELSESGRLADYAIVHFATHGAITGDVKGAAEPGLILTPPRGTRDAKLLSRDDGFLTVSEIATLKLDTDWAILSACNTAAGMGGGAEALSGLARAFFYAGARALLVSHWPVGSMAAVKLTTRALAELQAHPQMGRAEALRLSMRALIEKGMLAEAHPSKWAPFIVVGEGGTATSSVPRLLSMPELVRTGASRPGE